MSPRTRRVVARDPDREEALLELAVFESMHLGVGAASSDRIPQDPLPADVEVEGGSAAGSDVQ
jgi:hypothetical protein